MAVYNVHAGHNPSGKVACGAVGLLDESKENRLIKSEIIRILKENGHTVYDCTVDNGVSQNDVLNKIAVKCNSHTVDFDVSIHLNSGRNDYQGDGNVGGFEVWVQSLAKGKKEMAERIRTNMTRLGFKDRGTKTTNNLYILNHTKASALLLEICFVDDRDDYNLYQKVGYQAVAKAVAYGMMNKAMQEATVPIQTIGYVADQAAADGNWYYCENGKITNKTTVAQNKNGWWFVRDGKVDFGFSGIAGNQNGAWYVKNGKVDFDYSGTVVCRVENGQVIQ